MELIALGLIWLGTAITTGYIASQKGRDGAIWFGAGLFFSFFALVAVAASPPTWEQPSGTEKEVGGAVANPQAAANEVDKEANKSENSSSNLAIIFPAVLAGVGIVVVWLMGSR